MILDLGLVDYEKCYRLQRELVGRRRLGEIEDSVILAEHKSVFTVGRTGRMENLLVSGETLRSGGIKVIRVDRGGDITYHGPGQLVVYPVIDLREAGGDLHGHMRNLEEAAIRLLAGYSVRGERMSRMTGVWVGGKKIASIGIGASNWVTFHGLSVNINCDLNFFSMINPCGSSEVEMTSLERIKGRRIEMAVTKKRVLEHLEEIFAIDDDRHIYADAAVA